MKKDKFWWKTSFMVFIYAIVLISCMLVQDLICLIGAHSEIIYKINEDGKLFKILNGEIALPIATLSYIWVAICAAYVGVDRAAYMIKSSKMKSGETDFGEPKMIRRIILVSGIILFFGCASNCFVNYDFELNSLASAFGSSILLYIAGQKAIKSVKYNDGKLEKKEEELSENNEDEEDTEYMEKVANKIQDAAEAILNEK